MDATKVAIYIRVSTVHQVDKDSLPMQRKDLINYSEYVLNCKNYEIFEDAGFSGKNTIRPAFQRMMTRVRLKEFSHILVWKIDRISRNLLDFAEMYQELKKLGVTFVSKNEQFQTDTAIGEAMLKIILVFAELERNMTSERVTATMISRAGAGIWNGGKIPYGYSYDYETKQFTILEDEAVVVRRMFDLYEQYESLLRVSRTLNDEGFCTRAGGLWQPVTVTHILKSPFYVGTWRYNWLNESCRQKPKAENEWVITRNHHPAIVTEEQQQRVIKSLQRNAKTKRSVGKQSSGKFVHVFQGLVYCKNCNSPMFCGPRKQHADGTISSSYLCPSSKRKNDGCKSTSDTVLGEFCLNFMVNLLRVQESGDIPDQPLALQKKLLRGITFAGVSLTEESLSEISKVLHSGSAPSEIYRPDAKAMRQERNELSRLRSEKIKTERAIDRLTKLYLYSDNAMSESDFIISKQQLTDYLAKIDDDISDLQDYDSSQSISDEALISLASKFIIAQELSSQRFIHYQMLSRNTSPEVLRSFFQSTIDSIWMSDAKVQTIVFRSGLSASFLYDKSRP